MARVKLSGLIDDIRGTVSDVVFAPWKAGTMYVRKKAFIRNNPRSADQKKMRTFLQWFSTQWFDLLTQAQRVLWNDYAATDAAGRHGGAQYSGGGGNIIKGNTGVMSGFNAFLMINQRLVAMDDITTYDPATVQRTPPVLGPSPMVENLAVAYAAGTFTVTWTAPVGTVADDMLRIWVRSYDTGAHAQIVSYLLVTAETIGITNIKFTNGIVIPVLNKLGVYDFQADVQSVEGVLSAPSQIITEEAA